MHYSLSNFQLTVLKTGININIDCENKDLNDFFMHDSMRYQKELLSKRYCWIDDNQKTIAMASLSNDNIELTGTKKRKLFQRKKHFRYYPSVKIGRLGVDKNYKGCGLGSQILYFLKMFFVLTQASCKNPLFISNFCMKLP